MSDHQKENEGIPAEDSRRALRSNSSAETASGISTSIADATPHECHALLHQWRLHRTYFGRTYYWQCEKCRKQKEVPKRGLWKLLLTLDKP